jgi:hypothetical protein
VRRHLEATDPSRDAGGDGERRGAEDDDEPGGDERAEAEREAGAEDLEERTARLREAVAVEEVLPADHLRERGGLHRERDPHAGLHDEHPDDEPGGRPDVALGRAAAERQEDARRDERGEDGRRERGPSEDAPSLEAVDEHADEGAHERVRDVEREDHLEEVLRRRHGRDVESLLAAEGDGLRDGTADEPVGHHHEELHAHERREVGVAERGEHPVEEGTEPREDADEAVAAEAEPRGDCHREAEREPPVEDAEGLAAHGDDEDGGDDRERRGDAGDERDPEPRVVEYEEARREETGEHEQEREAEQDAHRVERVPERRRVVLVERADRRARLPSGRERRGVGHGEALGGDHRDVLADRDDRGVTRVEEVGVGRALVELPDEEDDRRAGQAFPELRHLLEVGRGHAVVDRVGAHRRATRDEVGDVAEGGHRASRGVAGEAGARDVRERLRPAVRLIDVVVVDDEEHRARRIGARHDGAHRGECGPCRLVDPLAVGVGPVRDVARGQPHEPRRGEERGDADGAGLPRASGPREEPADRDPEPEASEREQRDRRVHEAVVGVDRAGEEPEHAQERQQHRDRDGPEGLRARALATCGRDGPPDGEEEQGHEDERLEGLHPAHEAPEEHLARVGRRQRRVGERPRRAPRPDRPGREAEEHPEADRQERRREFREGRAEAEPAREDAEPEERDERHPEDDAGGRVRERRGDAEDHERDARAPRLARRFEEREHEGEQVEHHDVVEVADVGRRHEPGRGREQDEEEAQRVLAAPPREGTEREAREDGDPDHEERAEGVEVDPRDALQERAVERDGDAVAAGEHRERTPRVEERARRGVHEERGPPRVPGGVARRGGERRVEEERPAVREEDAERGDDGGRGASEEPSFAHAHRGTSGGIIRG